MNEGAFDAFIRHAAVVSRRGTLLTLGSAGLATLAGSPSAQAGKSNKKANRKARKKGKEKCRKQDDQCVQAFADLCADQEDPTACEAIFSSCCAFLAQCQTTAFFECVFANSA